MWQQPKTDWQPDDYFNIADYNRIKENIQEIRLQALTLWPNFDILDMGPDKDYADESFYADEINRFEENIGLVCGGIFPIDVGEMKTYYDNTPFIDWLELNRIENACLRLYRTVQSRIQGRSTLPLTLNGGDF